MVEYSLLVATGSPGGTEPNALISMAPFVFMILIFYFIAIRPTQTRQKKLEAMVTGLKPGDRIIINPGIFGTVVSLEDNALFVRVDDKTKIRVLKSAVADKVEDQAVSTEKK
jgi:preprotein translocase subunit YajC